MIRRRWKTPRRCWAARAATLSARVLVGVACLAFCGGWSGDIARADEPLKYRRIYAPADRIDTLLGGERYLPIEAAEFARLIETAGAGTTSAPSTVRPYLEQASYEARLAGDQLVEGTAKLTIVHQAQHVSLLPLAPCSLAISQPIWDHEPSAPAMLGFSASAPVGVVVEPFVDRHRRTLRFGWSLRGERDSAGGLSFDVQLPASPSKRLTLLLPAEMVPRPDVGLVIGSQPSGAGWRKWQIELGGHARSIVRVAVPRVARDERPPVLVRQLLTYDLSPRGLEVAAQFTLDVPTQPAAVDPLRQIALTMDPTLRLAGARFGEADVLWSISKDDVSERTRVVLELPEPLQGSARVLHLTAVAETVTDRLWRLPDIRAEDMFWVEGTARLLVPEALVLEQLLPVDCRQTGTEPLLAPRLGEAIELQYFSPAAAPEIVLTLRKATHSIRTATTLDLASEEVGGRLVADCEVSGPALFSLKARVSPAWIIDSVESVPAGAIDEWDEILAAEGDRRLTIRLARALAADAPLRLVIVGRRRHRALVGGIGVADLRMLRFEGASAKRKIMLVRATDPLQLHLSGDEELIRLDPAELNSAEAERFDQSSDGLMFVDDRAADQVRISLDRQPPRYSGQIHVEATVTGNTLVETYRVVCIPASARVERVVVHFLHGSQSALEWSTAGGDEQPLSARRLTPTEQQVAAPGAGGETWEVTLRRPQSEPFELRAVRTSPFEGEQAVNLASLPQATEQRGRVTVRSLGKPSPRIVNRRLEPIPAEPPPPGRFSAVRAAFRYEPARDATSIEPPLALAPREDDAAARPLAWVWSFDVHSKRTPGGTTEHYATLRIQNTGLRRIQLTLPTGAELLAISIDGKEVPRNNLGGDAEGADVELPIELPFDRKFPVVVVHYRTSGAPLGMFTSVVPRLPRVDLPVVARRWTLWLPPGYEAPDASTSNARARPSWSQRLFGPLGRARGSRRFHPLRADDWTGLLRGAEYTRDHRPSTSLADTSSADTSARATRRSSNLSSSPWNSSGPVAADTAGWSAYRIEGTSGTSGPIRVVRVHAVRMLGATLFLLVAALCRWRLVGHPIALVVMLGLSGAMAFVIPVAYVPIATGVFLGIVASLAVGVALRQPGRPSDAAVAAYGSSPTAGPAAGIPHTGRTIALLCVLLGLAPATYHAGAVGQTVEQAVEQAVEQEAPMPIRRDLPPLADTPVHKVFIPSDAQRQPTGSRYYVAESFYRQLLRRAAGAQQAPDAWMITRATYRGDLVRDLQPAGGAPEQMTVGRLDAIFDLHVLARNTEVRLPIAQGDAQWRPDEARLDGRPIVWRWDADPSALVIKVDEPGRYRLVLPGRPTLESDDRAVGFNFGTAPVADSRIELTLPADAPTITFPTASGAITLDEVTGRLVVELGATDRLAARWPRGADSANIQGETDIEELFWLHIGPGRVMLEARFIVQVSGGRPSSLRLLTDSRLRLSPFGEDSPVKSHRVVPGDPQTIVLELGEPADGEITIEARMLLTGTSGIGNLRLPRLQMLATRASRRLLAVSIDPELQYDERAEQQLEPLAVPDFVAAWGEVEVEPSFAHELPVANPAWSVATRPRPVETIADQTLVLDLRRGAVDVRFTADITTESGYELRYRLSAPADFVVEGATVLDEAGVERAARWSRDPRGAVTIFLTAPVEGRSHLELLGTLPVAPAGRFPLPRINIERAEIEENQIHIYRQPAVLVSVDNVTGLVPLEETAPAQSPPEQGRLVGRFSVEEDLASATLVVSPNEPRVSGVAVTSLNRQDDAWEATFDYHFRLEQGVVDVIRLEVPSWWSGPYQVEPAAAVTTVEIPGVRRRQVIVRPREAISGEYQLRIRAPLTFVEIERPRAPDITPLAASRLERFLVLPTGASDQRITWEARGVTPAELPDGFAQPDTAAGAWQTYRVVNQSPQAELKSVRQEQATPQIWLADVRVEVAADRSCRGVATFDLEPAGLAACELRLADGYRLVQATVAGLPAWPQEIDEGRWQLSLGPRNLPQRIEIVFASAAGGGIWPWSKDELHAPRLLTDGRDMYVERTLWTAYVPPTAGTATPIDAKSTTAMSQELARLRTTASLIDLGTDVVAEQGADGVARWYRAWAKRLAASGRAAGRQASSEDRTQDARAEVEATMAEQIDVAQRLGTTNVWAESSNNMPGATEPAELWQRRFSHDTPAARFIFPGGVTSLDLQYDRPASADLPGRSAAALLLGIVAGTVVVALRRGMPSAIVLRWPHAFGVAAGLFWWLWLSPSVVGWVVIAVTLGTLLRRS